MTQVHPSRDERDAAGADVEAINSDSLYAMYSVFATVGGLPEGLHVAEAENDVAGTGAEIRGFYDIGGFRADADLMMWTTAKDPAALQAAYHALRASELGRHLEPVWSVMAVHRPAEFNRSHVPSCFAGFAPRAWVCVYPFVRSLEWYNLDDADRSRMLREHGMAARDYPDVIASTLSAFALGDYEWMLAFEADELHRLTDVMRAQRAVEARLHVREETPFFTGPRVDLAGWAARQPTA